MLRYNLSQLSKHSTLSRTSAKGFTIIEVMIVLAIAGLILLIVFLAVPALQRNQRNTARKNDVSRVGGAVTEYISNNNGTGLTASAVGAGDALKISTLVGKLNQYTASTAISVATTCPTGTETSLTLIDVHYGCKCDSSTIGQVVAGTTRQVAIRYASEGPSANTGLCVDF